MPRNSSGVYSLPAGNPVVTNTTISSVWANTTLDDLATAMTDSLSRTGDGGMLAPFLSVAGTVGAPGISFALEPTSGLYRNANNDIRFAIAGVDMAYFQTNRFAVPGTAPTIELLEIDAAANNQRWDLAAIGEDLFLRALTDAGVATNIISVSRTAGAIDAIVIAGTAIGLTGALTVTGAISVVNSSAAPLTINGDINNAYTVTIDNDSNGTSNAARVNIVSGDASVALFAVGSGRTSAVVTNGPTGQQAVLRTLGSYPIIFGTNNTLRATLSDSVFELEVPLRVQDGSDSAPSIAFADQTNTGIWRAASSTMAISLNGEDQIRLVAGGIPMRIGGTAAADTVRYSLYTADLVTERGYFGFPTSSSDIMILRNIVGTSMSFRVSDNVTRLDVNTSQGVSIVPVNNTSGISTLECGFRIIPQNIQNGNYTCLIGDSGVHIYKASGGAGETITIPANSSVAYPIGTAITFVNQGGGTLSIAITTDTMTLMGTGATGTRTLADDGIATALKVASTAWVISGTGLS